MSLKQQLQFTAEEKSVYGLLFKSVDKEGLGIVTGEVARPIFEKSGLSTGMLRDVWQLADAEGNGFLTESAFFASLRLIGHCQNGAIPSLELMNLSGPIANLAPSAPQAIKTQPSGTPVSRQASSQAVFPPLTSQDVAKFALLFQRTAPNGVLNGDEARSIFLKANLPTPTLGQIWNLVDRQQSGKLSQQEFIMAMYLIQNTINGSIKQIPQFIPNAIWNIADQAPASGPLSPKPQLAVPQRAPSIQRKSSHSSITSSSSSQDWVISAAQKQQFDAIFDNLDKKRSGTLTPNEVAQFLMTSNLPQDTLGAIWDLADVDNSGEFTKREFSIALYLVNRKLGGGDLPNIVPDSLIVSALQRGPHSLPNPPQRASTLSSQTYKPQSSINDLASLNDLFSSPVVTPTIAKALTTTAPVKPQLTSSLTGTRAPFVPSSSFGQQMLSQQLHDQRHEAPSLLEEESDDDEGPISAEPVKSSQRPVIPARELKPHFTGEANPPSNYAALSNFSNEPSSTFSSQPAQSRLLTGNFSQPQPAAQSAIPENNDLLADSEVSGQLSLASTDIANISNQISSLTNQTTQLNDKRERATGELNRILLLKKDIESKLTKLRVLYDQEVTQVQEVESVLLQSKQETENLQKEASLMEANYHATQAKLQQLQVQYESSQKEIETLKERLGVVNAENIELSNQHEQLKAQQKQAASLLSVTQQQVNVLESKNSTLRAELEKTNKEVEAVEGEHANAKSKLESLKSEIPMLTAAISAAAATVSMTKSLLKGTNSTMQYHAQQKKDLEEKHLLIQQQKTPEDAQPMFSEDSGSKDVSAITPATEGEESQEPQEKKVEGSALDSATSNTVAASAPSEKTTTDTPVSSPPGSDFQYSQQYQNFNLPLGPPHSTSSSVLNNPPLSVRGEEDVSEPGTPSSIEEEIATPTGTISNQLHPHNEQTSQDYVTQSEGEVRETSQTSSGGESFEIVEAENDDAHTIQRKDTNEQLGDGLSPADEPSSSNLTINPLSESVESDDNHDENFADEKAPEEPVLSTIPGAFVTSEEPVDSTHKQESSREVQPSEIDQEFPPIKELDYDESDSSSDEEGPKEHFDDALDTLPESKKTAFDEFDDLEPAVAESAEPPKGDDLFDEFAGLEEALPESRQIPEFEDDANDAFNQGFSDSAAQNDMFNSFDNLEPTTETNNDEWEQLFEGFGNSNTGNFEQPLTSNVASEPQVFPVVGSHQDSHAHELAIQELTGMGFSQQDVIEALNKENWNLENATNHLLDHA